MKHIISNLLCVDSCVRALHINRLWIVPVVCQINKIIGYYPPYYVNYTQYKVIIFICENDFLLRSNKSEKKIEFYVWHYWAKNKNTVFHCLFIQLWCLSHSQLFFRWNAYIVALNINLFQICISPVENNILFIIQTLIKFNVIPISSANILFYFLCINLCNPVSIIIFIFTFCFYLVE